MHNWKTNLGGALNGFGLALVAIDPAWSKWGLLIAAAGAAYTGLVARDYNVSSAAMAAKQGQGNERQK